MEREQSACDPARIDAASHSNGVDRALFREAMSRVAMPVALVMTHGSAGTCGITVSSVTSMTDEPATIGFCIARTSYANNAVRTNRVVTVNLLAADQAALATDFARPGVCRSRENFVSPIWFRQDTSGPEPLDCAVSLRCAVSDLVEVGTHTLFICMVETVAWAEDAAPMIAHRRSLVRLCQGSGSQCAG